MSNLPVDIDRRCALRLHEQGIEMVPDEIREHRISAFAKIRSAMAEKGYSTPDSDEALVWLVKGDFAKAEEAEQKYQDELFEKEYARFAEAYDENEPSPFDLAALCRPKP